MKVAGEHASRCRQRYQCSRDQDPRLGEGTTADTFDKKEVHVGSGWYLEYLLEALSEQ
jgi:hypothetical protein